MSTQALREKVCAANLELPGTGLVVLTWGNVSGVDRDAGLMAIKPSGVAYDVLTPEQIVVLRLEDGEQVEGSLRPSSDTPTHLHLYRELPGLGGVVHTHSSYASSWAQAERELPCFGTTHADHFYGAVPLTRLLEDAEMDEYELNTGKVIVERLRELELSPQEMPGILTRRHGPFTWGKSIADAVKNAVILEEIARMAFASVALSPDLGCAPKSLIEKHFLRKHGPAAYYGQKLEK
jgi:L-ribulose-5-phosphate 4-epimerase